MSCCCHNKCGFTACSCIGVFISILFGAAIGVLYAFNFLPNIITAAWIAFGLGVLTLIILAIYVLSSAIFRHHALTKCLCGNTTCLLVGIFGTIISTIAVLTIALSITSIPAITVIAIAAFFFALMIIGLIALISCIVCRMCSRIGEEEKKEVIE